MLNKVTLIGRIGQVDLSATSSGKDVAAVSLATTASFKDKNSGEWKEKTTWHRMKLFGDPATQFRLGKYSKGDLLYVEGSIENSSYEKNNQKHYTSEVYVDGYPRKLPKYFKQSGEQQAPQQQPAQQQYAQQQPAQQQYAQQQPAQQQYAQQQPAQQQYAQQQPDPLGI